MEDAFGALLFDEPAKFIGCRRLLDGTAKIFLRTVTAHIYGELEQQLINKFSRRHSLSNIYNQPHSHHLNSGKKIKRYVLTMQEIAANADMPEGELAPVESKINFSTTCLYRTI